MLALAFVAGCSRTSPEQAVRDRIESLQDAVDARDAGDVADMLADDERRAFWGRNGLAFADCADLYSMPQKAADVILAEKRL